MLLLDPNAGGWTLAQRQPAHSTPVVTHMSLQRHCMFVLTRFEMQNTIRWRRPVVSKQSSNVTSEPRSLQCEQEQAGSAQPCGLQNTCRKYLRYSLFQVAPEG